MGGTAKRWCRFQSQNWRQASSLARRCARLEHGITASLLGVLMMMLEALLEMLSVRLMPLRIEGVGNRWRGW